MPINFEKQQHQVDCVDSIIELLKDFDFSDNGNLKQCFNTFYVAHNLPIKELSNNLNIDILMETGTGKTFAYIKTIFELNKQYRQNKFVIFVPRKAIREGVIQNIKLTSDYFFQEYGKRINLYLYEDKTSLPQIQRYLEGEELNVLVLTNSSIDKKGNILNKGSEFFPDSVLDKIKKLKPLVIIDEPHLLKGDKFIEVFKTFKSLYFRFGATFPQEKEHKLSNVVYVLDSVESFKQNLVKQIWVHTIWTGENSFRLINIKDKIAEFIEIEDNIESRKFYRVGDNIGIATITKIDSKAVYLSNREKIELKTISYTLNETEQRFIIRKTIEEHFKIEEENFKREIKTLSLFFIENIRDFNNNGAVKQIFVEEYKKIRQEYYVQASKEYKTYLDNDYKDGELQVTGGYFSEKTDDAEKVNLILKEKEKLLNFNQPLRFIFTCWALQEGWDNPNIFNICKLSNTKAEISKRQQVGRGLRICVNQKGNRRTIERCEGETDFHNINRLNVIVSGYENDFIGKIQEEILDGSFIFSGNKLKVENLERLGLTSAEANNVWSKLNENNIIDDDGIIKGPIRDFIKNNKEIFKKLDDMKYNALLEKLDNKEIVKNADKDEKLIKFKIEHIEQWRELWQTINRKAKIVYKNINEQELISEIADRFNKEKISPLRIKIVTQQYDAKENKVKTIEVSSLGDRNFEIKTDYLIDFAKENNLPLKFTLELFNKIDKNNFKNNPKQAQINLIKYIKEVLHSNLIQKISYDFENTLEIKPFDNCEIKSGELGRFSADGGSAQYLYDKIVYDSDIEKLIEEENLKNIGANKIIVFGKLPAIKIPTPYKTYNPDFAYYIEKDNDKKLFLVVESKGYNNESDIDYKERQKIEYAKKFFESLNEKVKDIDIIYKTRINKKELLDLLL
ncbi:MAG: DEAD/DEAH box helicase family protein [Rickettsiales bacterium]|jgi:type III restriction enzyme|nr:DEAD/DEAH box helicase family protein [Rickettsiales bacterium]